MEEGLFPEIKESKATLKSRDKTPVIPGKSGSPIRIKRHEFISENKREQGNSVQLNY
jgi:hypothetical protein